MVLLFHTTYWSNSDIQNSLKLNSSIPPQAAQDMEVGMIIEIRRGREAIIILVFALVGNRAEQLLICNFSIILCHIKHQCNVSAEEAKHSPNQSSFNPVFKSPIETAVPCVSTCLFGKTIIAHFNEKDFWSNSKTKFAHFAF